MSAQFIEGCAVKDRARLQSVIIQTELVTKKYLSYLKKSL